MNAGDGGGYGAYVEIEHTIDGEKITSLYAHMQCGSIGVSVGDRGAAGTIVGAVGSTGQATGPHLHLELFGADGGAVRPVRLADRARRLTPAAGCCPG